MGGNKIKCKTRTDQNMHTDCHYMKGSEQGRQVPRGQGEGAQGLDLRWAIKEREVAPQSPCAPHTPAFTVTSQMREAGSVGGVK